VQNVFKLRTALAIPLLTTVLAGCDLSGEDDEVVSCDGVTTIQNITDASIAAGDVAAAIEAAALQLPNNPYIDEPLSGNTGNILITGTIDSSTVTCGPGCDETTNNHAITAVLNNYSAAQDDALVTGTVFYGDNTVSEQNGSIVIITSGSISIAGDIPPSIIYDSTFTDLLCDPQLNGIFDTFIVLNSIGSSTASSDQTGTLTGNSGAFSFP
jgi:hypothetical protein